MNEDFPWGNAPRKAIKACPGKGWGTLSLREWLCCPFVSTGLLQSMWICSSHPQHCGHRWPESASIHGVRDWILTATSFSTYVCYNNPHVPIHTHTILKIPTTKIRNSIWIIEQLYYTGSGPKMSSVYSKGIIQINIEKTHWLKSTTNTNKQIKNIILYSNNCWFAIHSEEEKDDLSVVSH